ncbi:MAG: hypothetical protein U1E54_03785 [Candidatus Levybacteria bacterium]|nr:hypothetical protein [Candidatus Levybacteria bacterium]
MIKAISKKHMQRPVKDKSMKSPGRGWFGDPEGHAKAGSLGGRNWRKNKKKIKVKKND